MNGAVTPPRHQREFALFRMDDMECALAPLLGEVIVGSGGRNEVFLQCQEHKVGVTFEVE